MSLAEAWESHAGEWIAWADASHEDGFWSDTWPALRELLPPPGPGVVIDVGCGEGRAGRELVRLGYQVAGVERSPTLAAAAVAADPPLPVLRADAAALPFADQSAALVVASMSLMDIDDFDGAVREIGRVLAPGRQLCLAVVHPFSSAEDEDSMHTHAPRFSRPYLESRRWVDRIQRDGRSMTFTSVHRPVSAYVAALTANGMVVSALTEGGSGNIPWLLAIRADKLAQ